MVVLHLVPMVQRNDDAVLDVTQLSTVAHVPPHHLKQLPPLLVLL